MRDHKYTESSQSSWRAAGDDPQPTTKPMGPPPATERRMLVTPAMATEWLSHNTDNQPLNRGRAELYGREMAAGQWMPGHARIVIGRNGILCNGQHTLTAIVLSGVSAVCMVMWDDTLTGPRDWRGDSGRMRSHAFQAGTNATVWGVANLAAEIIVGGKTTPRQTERLLPEIADHHNRLSGTTERGLSVVAVRLAVVTRMKLHPVQSDEIAEMYGAFIHGTHRGLSASAAAFRDNLLLGRQGKHVTGSYSKRIDTLVRGLAVFDPTRDPMTSTVLIRRLDQRADSARRLLAQAWGEID